MATFTVLMTNLLVAAALAVGATASGWLRGWSRRGQVVVGSLLAGLALLDGVLLTLFVFGEDDYRGNDISRWDAYRSPSGGALGEMFVVSLALLGGAAALLVFAGLRGRMRLLGGTALACAGTCAVLVTATIIGFSAN